MGVGRIELVYDEKEDVDLKGLPSGVPSSHREELPRLQDELSKTEGVSAIIYVQTCAAEKRRRRRRGLFPDPDQRVFINTDVCEGCGDCGVQSNCVSILPVETELGRKRMIDQSSCNKDFSCVNGFCPSFVTVSGGTPKKAEAKEFDLGHLPEPELAKINGTYNVVLTGVGGTGVVTIGAGLAMAAHIDGKAAGMMEMAGLAQKGGAVHIHVRVAEKPEDISAIRVAPGEADLLLGGDLVVSAGKATLGLMRPGSGAGVVNSHEIITGDFTRDREFRLPSERLALSLEARLGERLSLFDATRLAEVLLGDSIFTNQIVAGAAWQQGLIPVSLESWQKAIELNNVAVQRNLRAFAVGRWAIVNPEAAAAAITGVAEVEEVDPIAFRAAHLETYQNANLSAKYLKMLDRVEDPELKLAVAKGYHKLLAYKDEYEVARMLSDSHSKAAEAFDGDLKLSYHLAPPFLGGRTFEGRPKKRQFGAWMGRVFPVLAKFKFLRGTAFDPFGHSHERKMERALIAEYEADLVEVLSRVTIETRDAAIAWAEVPLSIRGFGPVKADAQSAAAKRREEALAVLRSGPSTDLQKGG